MILKIGENNTPEFIIPQCKKRQSIEFAVTIYNLFTEGAND